VRSRRKLAATWIASIGIDLVDTGAILLLYCLMLDATHQHQQQLLSSIQRSTPRRSENKKLEGGAMPMVEERGFEFVCPRPTQPSHDDTIDAMYSQGIMVGFESHLTRRIYPGDDGDEVYTHIRRIDSIDNK
jgi:hypothetical protein